MGKNIQALQGEWQFRAVDSVEFPDLAAGALPKNFGEGDWTAASVPGSVHTDLLAAGKIADPFSSPDVSTLAWIEEKDWFYRTTFEVPEQWFSALGKKGRAVELFFESLDTFATIYLNDQRIGGSSNQFLPLSIDISERLRRGANSLVIHFQSAKNRSKALAEEHGGLSADHDALRVHARRMQCATGWTNAPRLSGCGILGPVAMRFVDRARLRSLHMPISFLSRQRAQLSVDTELHSSIECAITIDWSVERLDPVGSGTNYEPHRVWTSAREFKARPGAFRYAESVTLGNPKIWQPAGNPAQRQTLYRSRAVLRIEGEAVDEMEEVFGLCSVEVVDERAAGTFFLRVNGQPMFVRGATWVPMDMFPSRVKEEDVRQMVDMAAAANINLLRVWGGGVYESEAFYRRCDEVGILVWQDFMFARGEYPEHDAFWRSVQDEATHQIKRLRSHPCLALWCGNDGNRWRNYRLSGTEDRFPGRRIASKLLAHLTESYDRKRSYRSSTPLGGSSPNSPEAGDYHDESIWENRVPLIPPKRRSPPFVSSFGYQSFPTEDTFREFCADREFSIARPEYDGHNGDPAGNARIAAHLSQAIRTPADYGELIYLSQWLQAETLTRAIDYWRSRHPDTMGTILWHFNDCWPCISSSIVDHRRKPKVAWWAVKRAYTPLRVILVHRAEEVRAYAINEGLDSEDSLPLMFRLKTFDTSGHLTKWTDLDVTLRANHRIGMGKYTLASLGVTDKSENVIVGELISGKRVLSGQMISLVEPRDLRLMEPQLTAYLDCILANQRAVFLLRAQNIVRGVEVRLDGIPGARIKYDNCFDIWPNHEVWIQAEFPSETPLDRVAGALQYRCINDALPGRQLQWRSLNVKEGEGRAAHSTGDAQHLIIRMKTKDMIPKLGVSAPDESTV